MKIKGGSVENTLDLAVFGDILVWVVTFFGLVPWEKLFGRKKDFQEQLAEFGDESNVCVVHDNPFSCCDDAVSSGNGGSKAHIEQPGDAPGGYVQGPWGVVPYKCPIDDDVAAIMRAYRQGGIDGYKCRVGRRL